MPKVSVVVPIYNVEAYIEKCANSLFLQTLDDMEYIFVNDCTKDNSMQVLNDVIKRFPNRKNQIKIINHQTNKGLPQARKSGIEASTGEYIIHCDSDDWIDLNLYEKMYNKAIEEKSDLVVCDYCTITNEGTNKYRGLHTTNKKTFLVEMLFYNIAFNVWNKMYHRNVYANKLKYTSANMAEDLASTFQLVMFCERISYVSGNYYYYNGTSISITREETKESIIKRTQEACTNAKIVVEILSQINDKDFNNAIIFMKFKQRKLLMPIINDKEAYNLWKTVFPEINRDVLLKKGIRVTITDRIKFFLTLIGLFPLVKQYTRKNIC